MDFNHNVELRHTVLVLMTQSITWRQMMPHGIMRMQICSGLWEGNFVLPFSGWVFSVSSYENNSPDVMKTDLQERIIS